MNKIYVDGGTRGSVICLVDPQINHDNMCYYTVVKRRKAVGVQQLTNNDMEYLAIIYGIEYVNKNYYDEDITINSDSKIAVNQINDEWKCNPDNLQRLLKIVKRKMNGNVSLRWVPRDSNLAGRHLEKFY